MSVDPDLYNEIVNKINAKYENDIKRGDEHENPERLDSGSLALNLAMGGGVPLNRWTRIYGPYSSGKSLTGWNIIRAAQERGMLCCYYNVEKQYHKDFVEQTMGVNTEDLTVVEGTTIEEIGEKMEMMMQVCHLHVIDSCSIAVSLDELDADITAWRPGLSARAWGKVFRRLNERFDSNGDDGHTVILLDQLRMSFGMRGGPAKEEPPGGKVLDFQSSMSVKFKKGNWMFYNEEGVLDPKAKQKKGMSGDIEPDGIEIKARVEKSRVSRPLIPALMRLDLNTKEFDRLFEYVEAAKYYGAVEVKNGGNYYYGKGDNKIHLRGEKALREFIAGDLTFQQEIEEKALAAITRR